MLWCMVPVYLISLWWCVYERHLLKRISAQIRSALKLFNWTGLERQTATCFLKFESLILEVFNTYLAEQLVLCLPIFNPNGSRSDDICRAKAMQSRNSIFFILSSLNEWNKYNTIQFLEIPDLLIDGQKRQYHVREHKRHAHCIRSVQ